MKKIVKEMPTAACASPMTRRPRRRERGRQERDGQAGKAELSGTIQDPAGLPVPKAKVVAEDQATTVRYSTVSDDRGEYHVLGLPAGQYVLTVEAPGFHTYRQSGITLRLADHTALDVKLEIGQARARPRVDRKNDRHLRRDVRHDIQQTSKYLRFVHV